MAPAGGGLEQSLGRLDPSTIAVAAGRPAGVGEAVNVAVELSATFHAGGDLTYGREGNATWRALEEFNLAPQLALESLFLQVSRELA